MINHLKPSASQMQGGPKSSGIEISISEVFQRQVFERGSNPAVITPTHSLSYLELDAEMQRISNALRSAGIEKGDRVGIVMEQETWLIAAILGVLRCGAVYVPIDPGWTRHRSLAVLEDARPLVVLADTINLFRAKWLQERQHVEVLNGELLAGDSSMSRATTSPPLAHPDAEDLAYIYYTSGSTGPPKGVADTHRNVLHNVRRYTENLHISDSDRLTLVQTCGFSGAVSNIFGALMNGATVLPVNISRLTPLGAAKWFQDIGATIYHSVPSIFRLIAETGVRTPSFRVIRLEGDASNKMDIETFNAHFDSDCVLVNGLGATETGIIAQHVIHHGDVIEQDVVPVGKVTSDFRVRIVDELGRTLPHGGIGQIEVTSAYLAYGYWNKPELTRAAFRDVGDGRRCYLTGDLGVLHPDGVLEHRGRANSRIKISGEWLDLSVLENELHKVPGVQNAVLSAQGNEDRPVLPAAWVIPSEPLESTDELIATCRQQLFNACGKRIDVTPVDVLPLDSNGKINRQGGHAKHQVSAPRTPTEKQVAKVFADLLNRPTVGVESDFFALGGDSLTAVAAADAIDRELGTNCALGLLQHAPVVGELARLIDDDGGTADVIVPLQSQGSGIPFFCVHAHMGHVFNLRSLANHFGPHTPFFGIQAAGLTADQNTRESVQGMAAQYVHAIQQYYPSGPYHIGGYCFGSLVAIEMARLLREREAVVEFVGLIDPDIPGYNPSKHDTLRNLRRVLGQSPRRILKSVFRPFLQRNKQSGYRSQNNPSISTPALHEETQIERVIRLAHKHYQPGSYGGVVHVFSPQQWTPQAQLACEQWVGGEVRAIELNAPVQDMMREPWARGLADAICLQLDNVTSPAVSVTSRSGQKIQSPLP